MTTTSLGLALRIAQIIEENSDRDIQAAVELLESRGIRAPLLDFLAHRASRAANKYLRKGSGSLSRGASSVTPLRALQESDPDKFRILKEFDRMLRRGQALTTLEDLKRFGERISKDFKPRKSRKDSIPALIALLAERPTPDLEALIRFAMSFGVRADADEYQRLSRFLIKGRESES